MHGWLINAELSAWNAMIILCKAGPFLVWPIMTVTLSKITKRSGS